MEDAFPRQDEPRALYTSVSGDGDDPRYFPLNAVRWLIPPRDFAALVTESGHHAFAAELYNFRDEPRDVPAELYLLDAGRYELRLSGPNGQRQQSQTLDVTGRSTRVTLNLPPRVLCRVSVKPIGVEASADTGRAEKS